MRSLLAMAALAALTACDSVGGLISDVSTNVQTANTYRPIDYRLAAENRDMWVIVGGAVPGADAGALQQTTLAAMQRNATIATRFTAAPQNAHRAYKTVIIFNGPPTIQASALCREPNQPIPVVTNSELRIQAVFCRDDQFLSEVYSRAGGGNSLANRNFDSLIGQTMNALYEAPREEQRDPPGA